MCDQVVLYIIHTFKKTFSHPPTHTNTHPPTHTHTQGFSGAALSNVMNEAAITAARGNATHIANTHIDAALDRVSVLPVCGSTRVSLNLSEIYACMGPKALLCIMEQHAASRNAATLCLYIYMEK